MLEPRTRRELSRVRVVGGEGGGAVSFPSSAMETATAPATRGTQGSKLLIWPHHLAATREARPEPALGKPSRIRGRFYLPLSR